MKDYGDYSDIISQLESALSSVRQSWQDETAQSFDEINDNMKYLAGELAEREESTMKGFRAVREHYVEADVKRELLMLESEAANV